MNFLRSDAAPLLAPFYLKIGTTGPAYMHMFTSVVMCVLFLAGRAPV